MTIQEQQEMQNYQQILEYTSQEQDLTMSLRNAPQLLGDHSGHFWVAFQ